MGLCPCHCPLPAPKSASSVSSSCHPSSLVHYPSVGRCLCLWAVAPPSNFFVIVFYHCSLFVCGPSPLRQCFVVVIFWLSGPLLKMLSILCRYGVTQAAVCPWAVAQEAVCLWAVGQEVDLWVVRYLRSRSALLWAVVPLATFIFRLSFDCGPLSLHRSPFFFCGR